MKQLVQSGNSICSKNIVFVCFLDLFSLLLLYSNLYFYCSFYYSMTTCGVIWNELRPADCLESELNCSCSQFSGMDRWAWAWCVHFVSPMLLGKDKNDSTHKGNVWISLFCIQNGEQCECEKRLEFLIFRFVHLFIVSLSLPLLRYCSILLRLTYRQYTRIQK